MNRKELLKVLRKKIRDENCDSSCNSEWKSALKQVQEGAKCITLGGSYLNIRD